MVYATVCLTLRNFVRRIWKITIHPQCHCKCLNNQSSLNAKNNKPSKISQKVKLGKLETKLF